MLSVGPTSIATSLSGEPILNRFSKTINKLSISDINIPKQSPETISARFKR